MRLAITFTLPVLALLLLHPAQPLAQTTAPPVQPPAQAPLPPREPHDRDDLQHPVRHGQGRREPSGPRAGDMLFDVIREQNPIVIGAPGSARLADRRNHRRALPGYAVVGVGRDDGAAAGRVLGNPVQRAIGSMSPRPARSGSRTRRAVVGVEVVGQPRSRASAPGRGSIDRDGRAFYHCTTCTSIISRSRRASAARALLRDAHRRARGPDEPGDRHRRLQRRRRRIPRSRPLTVPARQRHAARSSTPSACSTPDEKDGRHVHGFQVRPTGGPDKIRLRARRSPEPKSLSRGDRAVQPQSAAIRPTTSP